MGNKKWIVVSALSIMLVLSVFIIVELYSKNTIVNAEENIIKKGVQQFSNKPVDRIKITDSQNKVSNKNVYELYDGDFFYYVDKDGNIQNIIKHANPKVINKISNAQAKNIADNILKKLNKNPENHEIKVKQFDDNNSFGFSISYNNKDFPGSYVYVDLFPDGSLLGVQIHDENLDNNALEQSKVTKEKSEQIFSDYFKNHKILKNFLKDIEGKYNLKRVAFHGVSAWQLTMKIPDYEDFEFSYIIDANTGEFLYKSEPKAEGFEIDESIEKKLDEIIAKEKSQ